jgi:hypothetical protein
MALVRLYVATNRVDEARQLVDAVLERDPRNLAARLAKVDLATIASIAASIPTRSTAKNMDLSP